MDLVWKLYSLTGHMAFIVSEGKPMSNKNIEIANTIVRQLGGYSRLGVMTGAHGFIAKESGVKFAIKNRSRNRVQITLNGMDLYDVVVWKQYGHKQINTVEYNDVDCYQLKSIVEQATGMYLSL